MKRMHRIILIALMAFTESHAVAKSFAAKRRQHVEPNRELVAIGAANLASAVSGGFPVAGGFARTAVSFSLFSGFSSSGVALELPRAKSTSR